MKRSKVFLVVFSISSQLIFAQAKPAFNQYILNNYLLNPAISGIENYADIKISHRRQWQGITGAPVTSYVSFNMPIGKTDYNLSPTSFSVPGSNPRGEEYWRSYTAPDAHHGIGATVVSDKAGYLNRWSAQVTYAYHRPIGVQTTLSGGFAAGLSSTSLDKSKINWATLNPNDPAVGVSSGELKKLVPEIGAGLFLYSAKYFAGLSVLNIVPGKNYKFTKAKDYGTYYTPNYFFTAGYRVQASEDVSILPSVMAQYWQPELFSVHVNAKAQYRDIFWFGAGYRHADLLGGFNAMAGLYLGNAFSLSYAYEAASTGRMRTYAGNTHEFLLGFTIGNKYDNSCPRNVW